MPLKGEGDLLLFVADSGVASLGEDTQASYAFQVASSGGSGNGSDNATSSTQTGYEIRATLSWLDPPAPAMAARPLLHDLDLTVVSPRGQAYVMWMGSGERDDRNVNERVVVPVENASEAGTWTVFVDSGSLTTESQSYSLIVTGPFSAEDGVEVTGAAASPLRGGHTRALAALCGLVVSGVFVFIG